MMLRFKLWFVVLVAATAFNLSTIDDSWALPSYSIRLLNSGESIGPGPGSNIHNDQIGHDALDGDFIVSGTDGSVTYLYELGIPFGGLSPTASDLNDNNEIVGNASFNGVFASYAYYYSNGSVTNLGTLNGNSSLNDTQSTAVAMNNNADIVGYSVALPDSEYYQPYLYTEGEMFAFEDILSDNSGWTFLENYGWDLKINDLGWISGMGYLNGVLEEFVMTPDFIPTPEPATIILLGTGLLGLAGSASRKKNRKG